MENDIKIQTDRAADILARILASENITIVYSTGAKTAYFNTQTRTMTLPSWSRMDRLTAIFLRTHEIGHALYSPVTEGAQFHEDAKILSKEIGMRVSPTKLFRYINAIEDARIERLMCVKFRGLAGIMKIAHSSLVDIGFYGSQYPNTAALLREEVFAKLPLIDRMVISQRLGRQKFSFRNDIEEGFFDRSMKNETYNQVEQLAYEIYLYCEASKKEEKKPVASPPPSSEPQEQEEMDSMSSDEFEDVGDESSDEEDESSENEEEETGEEGSGDSDNEVEENEKESPETESEGNSYKEHIKKDPPKNSKEKEPKEDSEQLLNDEFNKNLNDLMDRSLRTSRVENFVYHRDGAPTTIPKNYKKDLSSYFA